MFSMVFALSCAGMTGVVLEGVTSELAAEASEEATPAGLLAGELGATQEARTSDARAR